MEMEIITQAPTMGHLSQDRGEAFEALQSEPADLWQSELNENHSEEHAVALHTRPGSWVLGKAERLELEHNDHRATQGEVCC